MKFKLDFDIYYATDRLEAIKSIDLSNLTKSELETISNYILYGKDSDGTSIVDRKEVQIKTKFNSYQRNRNVSLEGLMESPTFDENIFKKDRQLYKKPKPQIDKVKAAKIPGMTELWDSIERLEKLEESTTDQTKKYYLHHQVIELRKQQYRLMDSVQQTIFLKKNKAEYFTDQSEFEVNYVVLPRGFMKSPNDWEFKEPRRDKNSISRAFDENLENLKVYLDFRNQEHLYQLVLHYEELKEQGRLRPDSPINNILWTLDFYMEKAQLSPQQKLIVECKKQRMQNKDIRRRLQKELGIDHKENYISTIWKKTLGLISAAADLNYDEWLCKDYDKAWKVCNRCRKELLKDPRVFVRKAKSVDGLVNCCKKCEKEKRQAQRIDFRTQNS